MIKQGSSLSPLLRRPSGKLASTGVVNPLIDRINQISSPEIGDEDGNVWGVVRPWVGYVVDHGPADADDDFTDHRYWVQFAAVHNGINPDSGLVDGSATYKDAIQAKALDDTSVDYLIVVVENFAERDAGTHNLPTDGTHLVLVASYEYDKMSPAHQKWIMVEGGRSGTFPVKVFSDGGSAGGIGSTCSFTYTVLDLNGNDLKDGTNPASTDKPPILARRIPNLTYTVAPDGSYATAFYDETGTLRLVDVQETISTTKDCG